MSRRYQYTKNKRKQRRKEIEELVGNTCSRCKQEFPFVAMDFHHRDANEKDTGIGDMLTHSWKRILEEVNKCDLLCACCHRIVHEELRQEEENEELQLSLDLPSPE